MPCIIAGIRLAIGRGLIGMIIAVPVIVLMVLGVSLTTLLKWTGRKITPWSNANR